MDGTLDVIHRMDRVIFELLREITMIRANYSKGLRKFCVSCSAALNQWARNENDA